MRCLGATYIGLFSSATHRIMFRVPQPVNPSEKAYNRILTSCHSHR